MLQLRPSIGLLVAAAFMPALVAGDDGSTGKIIVMQYPQPNCGSYTNNKPDGNTAEAIRIVAYDPTVLHQPGYESTPERCINFDFESSVQWPMASTRSIMVDWHAVNMATAWAIVVYTSANCTQPAAASWQLRGGMPGATAALTPLPTVWAGPIGFGGSSFKLGTNYNQPLGWDPTKVCRWADNGQPDAGGAGLCVCVGPNPPQLVIGSIRFIKATDYSKRGLPDHPPAPRPQRRSLH